MMISLLLQESKRNGADRISLGTPEGCKASKTLTSSKDAHSEFEELENLEQELESLGIPPDPIFSRTPSLQVPVWLRIDGKWVEIEGFPFRSLHEVISVLESMFLYDSEVDQTSKRKMLNLVNSKKTMYAELWFEDTFTYTIVIDNFTNEVTASNPSDTAR